MSLQVTIIATTNGNNLKLAELIKSVCEELQYEIDFINLEDQDLPLYTPTQEKGGIPEKAIQITETLIKNDLMIFVAPEYNGSIPPVLNNMVAWVSRAGEDWRQAFNNKMAVVATHSGGGGLKVCRHMREQLEHLGTFVHPRPILTNFGKEFNLDSAKETLSSFKKLIG
ncbi:MAG: NADPH-dependent FMN reductase [Planctomycetota bacterium]|nr:MAG: NADPH-dependent FMN reductase [Planctomycetota bacterium]